MKLINKQKGFSTPYLRRMTSWVMKQVDVKAKDLLTVTYKTSKKEWKGWATRMTVLIGVNVKCTDRYPFINSTYAGRSAENGYPTYNVLNPVEALVMVAAHELYHTTQLKAGFFNREGRTHAALEKSCERETKRVLELFRSQRETLVAQWKEIELKRAALAPPKPDFMAKRIAKATTALARWERKLKLAKGKVKKYAALVKRYAKKTLTEGEGR